MPPELKDFNWGAFLLTFIWGIKHRAWITLLAVPLIIFQMPYGLNWILYSVLQFYCGFNGNMWAYQVDWWMKPKDFRKNQAIWGAVAIILNITIPLAVLLLAGLFVSKSSDNPERFIKNAQCSIAYSKIKEGFKTVSLNSTTNANSLAKSFEGKFNNAKTVGDTVNFSVKSNGKNVDVYYISFFMNTVDDMCSIKKKNCKINSSFILPPEIDLYNHCQFYFDLNRQILPDEQTKNSLKKGLNIFKYL